ncbi:MAG: dihydrodipicolinate synthase family protein [Firmicutes bacterium]|nr:dihydrodipicolinate synthase family protein [Bacillota bacterium]
MFRMKGVNPPMITPFLENGDVDYDGLKTLVSFLRERVDGLFITGSYGSGALMSVEERKKVTEITVKAAADKIPVTVMAGTTNNRQTMELVQQAEAAGADAVAAVGPYYFTHNDDSVCYFFEDMVKAAKEIPVYVYNNPKFQGYPMSLELLKRLKGLGVRGIKDATFDIIAHATYQRVLKDENFDVVLGTEAMWLSARALGAEAFIPGLANAFPEICGQMYREGMEGNFDACRQTQFKVNRLREIMYLAKSTQLAIYAMLEIRGVLKSYPRAPFISASEGEKKRIFEELSALGVLDDSKIN